MGGGQGSTGMVVSRGGGEGAFASRYVYLEVFQVICIQDLFFSGLFVSISVHILFPVFSKVEFSGLAFFFFSLTKSIFSVCLPFVALLLRAYIKRVDMLLME